MGTVSTIGSCQVFRGGLAYPEVCPWIWTCASSQEISRENGSGNESESVSAFEKYRRPCWSEMVCLCLGWDYGFCCETARVGIPCRFAVNGMSCRPSLTRWWLVAIGVRPGCHKRDPADVTSDHILSPLMKRQRCFYLLENG